MEDKLGNLESVKKRFKLIYDVAATPEKISFDGVIKLADQGVVVYDSSKGNRPKLVSIGTEDKETEVPVRFVDTDGIDIDVKALQERIDETKYWEKEIHRCSNSPLYYFKNYKSLKAEITIPDEKEFVASLGLTDILVTTGEVEKTMTDEELECLKKYRESITIENLKALKPLMDEINKNFEIKVDEIVKRVKKLTGINSKNDAKLREGLCNYIRKNVVVGEDTNPEIKGEIDSVYFPDCYPAWGKSELKQASIITLCRIIINSKW